MRTYLRGKISLLFLTIAVLIAVPAVALADVIVEDGDTVLENNQNPVELGTVAPGAQVTKNASFTLQCNSAQHIEGSETLALNFNSTSSKVFNSDDTAAASGSVSVVTTNPSDPSNPPSDPLKVRFPAIPSGWPTDGNQCATTPQTLAATDTAGVTITAPNAPGTYYALAQFDHSQSATQPSDIAGNNEIIRYNFTVPSDTTAPTSTASGTVPDGDDAGTAPDPYTGGSWTNKDVTVSLNATDNAGGSGVKELTYSATGADPISPAVTKAAANLPTSFTIDAEGTTTISYFAKDNNNNVETAKTFVVKIDKTAPTVTPASVTDNVWRNTSLSQIFAASDGGSGLANAGDASFTLTASDESADASTPTVVSKTVSDVAGNSTTRSVSAKIDLTDPNVSVTGVSQGGTYTTGDVPTPGCETTDGLSGVNTDATVEVTGGNNGFGTLTATCSGAEDNAGNTNSASVTYGVSAAFNGFLQPIDGHSVNTGKYGRTYPIKWQLRDSSGALISDTTAQLLVGMMTGGQKATACTSFDLTDTDVLEESTTGNTALRYDATSDQFIYNYKAPSSGSCYIFAIRYADGLTTQQIDFKFTK
jgi:hypothetical protein